MVRRLACGRATLTAKGEPNGEENESNDTQPDDSPILSARLAREARDILRDHRLSGRPSAELSAPKCVALNSKWPDSAEAIPDQRRALAQLRLEHSV